jgi:hypothetical protein
VIGRDRGHEALSVEFHTQLLQHPNTSFDQLTDHTIHKPNLFFQHFIRHDPR